MIKVSVIMSIYKEPLEWISLSIESILKQTYSNFEFIIVNDNPDREYNNLLLEEYSHKDNRIVVIKNESNIGLTKSLNKAILFSTGDYIARMDADDISSPNRFEKQLLFFSKNSDITVCYSNYSRINEVGSYICQRFQTFNDYNINYITYTNPIGHSTVMFKKDICQIRSPLYDEDYRRSQDYELWSFLYLSGVKFGYIDESLLNYRVSKSQITSLYKSSQDSNLKQIRKRLIINYLIKISVIKNYDEFNESAILKSEALSNVKVQEGDALYPIVYMLYYGACKKSYIFTLKYIFNGLAFRYGFRKTLYILLLPIVENRWDHYLI